MLRNPTGQPKALDRRSRWVQRALEKTTRMPWPAPRTYNLTVGAEPPFLWFRVAKTGTRSMLSLFREHARLEAENVRDVFYSPALYRNYFAFSFVRDPWDRLVSTWKNKILKSNHFRLDDAERERLHDFPHFVDWVAKRDLSRGDPHIRYQTHLIDLNRVDFIGRFECFEDDLRQVCAVLGIPGGEIPHHNRSEPTPYRSYYDEDLARRVEEIYAPDVRMFGYSF